MRILLIHTCGVEGSVAVADTDSRAPVRATAILPPRTFSEGLMPAVRAILDEAGWQAGDLGAIGVVRGPGSFTGVRTGLSVGKGLCEALGIPLIGVSRLALLAESIPSETVHAVLDAGRGEFYYGLYRESACAREALVGREELLGLIGREGIVAICEEKVASELAGLPFEQIPEPIAGMALALVLSSLAHGSDGILEDANYLRRTDGEIFAKPVVRRVAG
jgi:tRNA threonylcarbamoyladenosine biosynthesis protein TsaB